MIKHILVPLDGSDLAEDVLPWVADIAKGSSAEVSFIQVVGAPADLLAIGASAGAVLSPEFLADELEAETRAAESHLSSLATKWREKGIGTKYQVVQEVARSAAAASIIEYARTHDVDLIAMSTHGRSGLSRLIFGSVAEEVLREAGLPVLLVKPGQKKTSALAA